MKLVVDHLTRMRDFFICVAGFDEADGRWIRPLPRAGRLETKDLMSSGGVFDLGQVVELGSVTRVPMLPEVEDCKYAIAAARHLRYLEPAEFWAGLVQRARHRLTDIFGKGLVKDGRTCCVAPGRGTSSLGCLGPLRIAIIRARFDGALSVRVKLTDLDLGDLLVPLTDLRCFRDGQPDEEAIELLARRVDGSDVCLSVGLSRAYQPPGKGMGHWLQINNVHRSEDRLWRVPVRG